MKKLTIAATLAVALASAPGISRADDDDGSVSLNNGPSLKLYGFADFNFRYAPKVSKTNSWYNAAPHYGAATIGNLNLYLDGRLTQRIRSLVEVRFTYAPNGSITLPDGKGNTTKGSTSTADYGASYNASFNWGGIDIERAWIEYRFSDAAALKLGEFLTPYGVWNEDHGSPTLIGTKPPYVLSQEWFPRHQMGAYAYGSHYFGPVRVGYALTLSNGRIGTNSDTVKTNNQPGLGGRVFAEGESLGSWHVGSWRVGASGFHGRFTQTKSTTTTAGVTTTATSADYREDIVGADVTWKFHDVTVISEAMYGFLDYTSAVTTKDTKRYGGYALASYQLPYGFIPWTQFDFSRSSTHSDSSLQSFKLGLNKIIAPGVVIKLSANRVWYEKNPNNKDQFDEFVSQAAWAF